MSQENVALVRAIYDAFAAGDVPAVLGAMSPDMVWNEAENFPYADGNPYCGPDAILSGVFARIGAEWDGFEVVVEELLEAISSRAEAPGDSEIAAARTLGGDTVVALGRYRGTCKATGKTLDAQLAHVWRIAGGKAVSFQQYTDTLQAARVTGAA